MKIDDSNLEGFTGVTAGVQQEERWQYSPAGYNATEGIFYVGEEQVAEMAITPFAMRQCKEVTDAAGVTHRYPIKTKRSDMAEGDITTRLQVVGLIGGEMHIFGARSWTARAAWANPMGGPYHDVRFEGGIWHRLNAYIKETKNNTGMATAPLCWEIQLSTGDAIDLSSAANAKQKSKGHPIVAQSMRFVGAEQAAANEKLYVDEAIDEWVLEWNKMAVAEAAPERETEFKPAPETADELIPF